MGTRLVWVIGGTKQKVCEGGVGGGLCETEETDRGSRLPGHKLWAAMSDDVGPVTLDDPNKVNCLERIFRLRIHFQLRFHCSHCLVFLHLDAPIAGDGNAQSIASPAMGLCSTSSYSLSAPRNIAGNLLHLCVPVSLFREVFVRKCAAG